MADFSGAFSDLVPQTAAPAAATGGPADFSGAFSDLVPSSGVSMGPNGVLRVQMGNPEPKMVPAPAVSPGMDFLRSIPGGILGGLSGALSAGGQAAHAEMGIVPGVDVPEVPDAATTKGILEQNVTGQLPEPQGRAGKFGASIGEFVGNPASYIAPGSIPAKIGMAALAGLGSEAGGQLTEGTAAEPFARFLGAAAGAGVAAKAFQPGMVGAAIGPKPSSAAPSIDALKGAATAGYESPEVAGVTLNSNAVASKMNTLIAELGQDIHPVLAPKTFTILESASKAPPGSISTFANLRSLRRMLGKAAASPDPTEREAAQTAIKGVDQIMTSMPSEAVISGDPEAAAATLKTANANYSAAKTAEKFDKRVQNAEMDAEAANSGMNVGNRIRQQAKAILKSDKLRRGFKQDEIAKLRAIVGGSSEKNTIRWFSNLFGGGGGIGTLAAFEVGKHVFGTFGAALAPVGMVLKHIENSMTIKQAHELSEMIRSRAPAGQAISNAARDWEKARAALISGPNSAKYAAFSLASRNLSNNLATAGIRVHPLQLIKAASDGPVDSRADEKKQ